MKVTQCLWFEKDAATAVRFYTSLIPNSHVADESALLADSPSGPAGSVKTIRFTLGGQNYFALQAGPYEAPNHAFSIMVEVDTQQELDRLWDALKEGGSTEQCGWLKDRWGISWQIIPKRLGELMTNPATAQSVSQQMLKMVKLDFAPLEAAAGG